MSLDFNVTLNKTKALALNPGQASFQKGYAEGFNEGLAAAVSRFEFIVVSLFVLMLVWVAVSRGLKIVKRMEGDPTVLDSGLSWRRLLESLDDILFTAVFTVVCFFFVVGYGVPVLWY